MWERPICLRSFFWRQTTGSTKTNNRDIQPSRLMMQRKQVICPEKEKTTSQGTTAHLPCSNRHQNNTVKVEFTPLLYIVRKGCAEQGSSHHVGRARQEDGGQLISEPRLPVFKQLVWLIHHQPLHTRNREVFLSVRVTCGEGESSNRPSQMQGRCTHPLFSGKASSKARFDKDSRYLVKSIAGGSCFSK